MSNNTVSNVTRIEDNHAAAKAIEVAAMLGDSVVDVKHCMDPQSGTISKKTWGLAAAGLACVLFSAASFGIGISTAARNKGGFDYWTHVAKKPAGAFRAEQLSFGYDWAAFGGLALGVGALAGALSRSRRERRSPFYKIGTAADVQQPVVGAPSESFPLVAPHGDDFVFNFGPGVSGEVAVGDKAVSLAELAASGHARPSSDVPGAFALPIPMNGRIRATVGQTSFLISGVAKPSEQPAPFLAAMESRTMGYFAGSLAAHLGLVVLLSQVPVDDSSASIDVSMVEDITTSLRDSNKEDMAPEKEELEEGGGGSEGAAAAKLRLEDGQAGDDKAQNKDGHQRIANKGVEAQLSKAQAIEAARSAGVLGNVSFANGDFFADLNATSYLSSGPDAFNVRGPLFGAEGTGYGTFGYGRSGFGNGCDAGTCAGGDGIIGTNGYGRIGLGKYGRDGYAGPLSGVPGGRKHVTTQPTTRIGEPTGTGIDRAIIRRYIKRSITKISYCYEKELLAKPGLDGTVNVSFFIGPTGAVTSAVGTGMDKAVSSCVAEVVGNIAFPRMEGTGGGVQVNYPFTFHPAGNS